MTKTDREMALEAFEAWLKREQKMDVQFVPAEIFELYLQAENIRDALAAPVREVSDETLEHIIKRTLDILAENGNLKITGGGK